MRLRGMEARRLRHDLSTLLKFFALGCIALFYFPSFSPEPKSLITSVVRFSAWTADAFFGGLVTEIFAEIVFAGDGVIDDFFGGALQDDSSVVNQEGAIDDG